MCIRDSLLILTKLESGEERIKREDVDLRLLVEEVFDLLEPQAKERNISLINSVDKGLKVKGDWDKLFLLLKNLVDNAIKYNKEGGKVEVKAKRENQYVQLQVQDTGIGIPKEQLPFIFERFYRVDPSRSRNLGGTGLGLSIVKHIALSHGGSIEVQSKEGVGSIFSVFLPLE